MEINHLVVDFANRIRTHLDLPDVAIRELESLRKKIQLLGPAIGSGAKNAALRALNGSEDEIRRARAREIAEALASALRDVGVHVEPLRPPRRKRRKKPTQVLPT